MNKEVSKFGYFDNLQNIKDNFKKLNKKLNIHNRIMKLEVENFEHLPSNTRINLKLLHTCNQSHKNKVWTMDGSVGGREAQMNISV